MGPAVGVSITSTGGASTLALLVDDDGPALQQRSRGRAGEWRGLDQAAPGTGFGLAIVRDLALHGGELILEDSPLGGLRVGLDLRVRPTSRFPDEAENDLIRTPPSETGASSACTEP